MGFRSKAYKDGATKIEEGRAYAPLDALRLVGLDAHSVTSPSRLGPSRLGAKTSLLTRSGRTPACPSRVVVSWTIAAGPAT